MLSAFLKAFVQLVGDPRLWKYVVLSVLLSLAVFCSLWAGLGWVLKNGAHLVRWDWLRSPLEWGGWVLALVVALLLFPATFGVLLGFFQENVADAVEARHYAHLPPADGASVLAGVGNGIRFLFLLTVLNGLALPLYLALLMLAGSGAVVFALVNAVLFGREYFEVVAARRMPRESMDRLRRGNRGVLFGAGLLISLLSLVPVVNLLVPVWGIGAMVHVFHSLQPPPVQR